MTPHDPAADRPAPLDPAGGLAAARQSGSPGRPTRVRPAADPIRPGPAAAIRIEVDGESVEGVAGQTIAGVLMGGGRLSWRRSRSGRPRGVFCGIGVCFDCLVVVNGLRDVRACQRRAVDGDRVELQEDDHG